MDKKAKAVRPIKDELDMALEDYPEIAALREKQEPLKTDKAGNRERSKIDKKLKNKSRPYQRPTNCRICFSAARVMAALMVRLSSPKIQYVQL